MFSCARRGSILLALALVAQLSSTSAQTQGGASPTSGGRGIRRTTRLFVVDDTPSPCRFSADIQSAVDAASDGDVVLVKSGNYTTFAASRFLVDGKAIALIGEGRPTVWGGPVQNLAPEGVVVIRGFEMLDPPWLEDDQGFVWFEDCIMKSFTLLRSRGGAFRCRHATPGSNRVNVAVSSTFVAYHSMFYGGGGIDAYCDDYTSTSYCEYEMQFDAGYGGTAVSVNRSSSAYLFGSTLRGGPGGNGEYCACNGRCLYQGCGGSGLDVDGTSSGYVLDSLLQGAPEGLQACGIVFLPCDGFPFLGAPVMPPGLTGEYSVDSPVEAGAPLTFHFRGPPGRQVYVRYASECTPSFEPVFRGYALVPISVPPTFVGVLPPSGELDVTQSFGNLLEPGAEARVIYLQADFYDPVTAITVLGTPSALVVYRDPCP